MTRRDRIAATIKQYPSPRPGNDRSEDAYAAKYYGIGHGDYSERHGFSPGYIVWAWINGKIQHSEEIEIDPDTGNGVDGKGATHGGLWGHSITDLTYKGRYEPETGQLSVVVPDRFKNRPLPTTLVTALERKFKTVKKIHVFE